MSTNNIISLKEWKDYTNAHYEMEERASLINKLCRDLEAKKVLEVGCNVGNNLKYLKGFCECHGVDFSDYALMKGKEINGFVNFKLTDAKDPLPYLDNEFDVVITRGLLIHIPNYQIHNVIKQLFRVSSKYIINIEYFGEDSKAIEFDRFGDNFIWFRDMRKLWSKFKCQILRHELVEDFGERRLEYLTIIQK